MRRAEDEDEDEEASPPRETRTSVSQEDLGDHGVFLRVRQEIGDELNMDGKGSCTY